MGRGYLPVIPLMTSNLGKKSPFHAGSQLSPLVSSCHMVDGLTFRTTRRGQVIRLKSVLELGQTLSLNANLSSTNLPSSRSASQFKGYLPRCFTTITTGPPKTQTITYSSSTSPYLSHLFTMISPYWSEAFFEDMSQKPLRSEDLLEPPHMKCAPGGRFLMPSNCSFCVISRHRISYPKRDPAGMSLTMTISPDFRQS